MQILDGVIHKNEINANARGGTELMTEELVKRLGNKLEGYQIIVSRLRDELRPDKHRIYICHDLEKDDETFHLKNDGWKKFHKIVFVSHWQQQRFLEEYKIPWSRTAVLRNAIVPIDVDLDKKFSKKKKTIDIIYHTTPHRGLNILVPVFEKLAESHPELRLHVYSSFKIYGWETRDEDPQFKALFDKIKKNPQMKYYGSVSNAEIREVLPKMDIFAYPSIWLETSCISLIEAMSAGLFCIHPNYGALYETAANWTFMYNYMEDLNQHANYLYNVLDQAVSIMSPRSESLDMKLRGQKSYADLYYAWDVRAKEWENLLLHVKQMPVEIETPSVELFSYKPTF